MCTVAHMLMRTLEAVGSLFFIPWRHVNGLDYVVKCL
jgi:hypothetical protein